MSEEREAIAEQQRLADAYHRVFDPAFPEGQLVLDDILSAAGVLDAATPGDEANSTGLVWREGRRSLAIFILRRVSLSPAELMLMQRRRALRLVHPPGVVE
jgi:hypothetical protein